MEVSSSQVSALTARLDPELKQWREFLSSLKQRGCGVTDSITSDSHEGIKSVVTCVFPGVKWQRCQSLLQQNAQAYVPKVEMKVKVATDIRRIFNAPDRHSSQTLLEEIAAQYEKTAPRLRF